MAAPAFIAASKAGDVFSGARPLAPRCPKTLGLSVSRYFIYAVSTLLRVPARSHRSPTTANHFAGVYAGVHRRAPQNAQVRERRPAP
jgi:hypothetical protein